MWGHDSFLVVSQIGQSTILLNKKASKSGSRENTAYLKTVLHWKKDLTIDLGCKLSKLEGQSEVVEEIWCETCRNFSSDRSSSVGDLIQYL